MPEKAMRFNAGKAKLSLVLEGGVAIEGMARVLEYGTKKYARGNWRKDMVLEDIMDSMLRHQNAVMNGELIDPETGLPHADHIFCNAMFLSYHYHRLNDERPLTTANGSSIIDS